MNKSKYLIPAITLFSSSAIAQNVDVGSAALGALVTVLIRGVIAFCLFKLVALNLTRKNIDTSIKTGRWVGAWLMSISILTHPSLHKSDLDFYVGSVIMAVVWFAIGFVIGYIWRKLKPLKVDLSNNENTSIKPKSKIKLSWIAAFAIAIFFMVLGFWIYASKSSDKLPNTASYLLTEKPANTKSNNSEWVFFDKDKTGDTKIDYFYDVNNIVKNSNSNYLVNVAYVFDGYVFVTGFDGKESIPNVKYAKRLIEFDCKELKIRKIKSDLYGSLLSDSNQVRLNISPKIEDTEFKNSDFATKLCPVLKKIS